MLARLHIDTSKREASVREGTLRFGRIFANS